MLTKDENLIDLEAIIQYKIVSVEDWTFNIKDPETTLRASGESTIRRVVANHSMDESLTENKGVIQQEIFDDLQKLIQSYGLGAVVTQVQLQDVDPPAEVIGAFKEVQNAKETQQSRINEAQGIANDIVPKARGEAAKMINEAEAYKEKRVKEATGDVANFNEILKTYQQGKEVTRTRLYYEMVQEVFPDIEKYIVNDDGTMKFLPLTSEVTKSVTSTKPATTSTTTTEGTK
ncbi:Modulator of FtsH protease HflK [compost metagenome]